MFIRARHYRTDQLIDVSIHSAHIETIAPANIAVKPDLQVDYVSPAYFDLQINGGLGVNLTSVRLTLPEIEKVVETCAIHGIAAFCPTVITAHVSTITSAFTALRQACENSAELNEAMPCFHLEGPFISAEDGPRGAHPREHVQPAKYELFQRWQEAAGGRIKLLTLAPEVPGAIKLIEQLVKADIIVALGHSAGPSTAIRDGILAGARLSTHLGNGCGRMIPRHDNVLWEQLAADELMASVITDGHHLPWNLVQNIIRCKTLERIIVTCDASPLAGLAPGRYDVWGQTVIISDEGKIVLAEQGVLAGSWEFTSRCVEKLMKAQRLSYQQAHPLAADHPRRLLGLPVSGLHEGEVANLLLLQQSPSGLLIQTQSYIRGKLLTRPAIAERCAGEEC